MSAHSAKHRALEKVGSKVSVLNGLSVVRDSCRNSKKFAMCGNFLEQWVWHSNRRRVLADLYCEKQYRTGGNGRGCNRRTVLKDYQI